MESAENQDEIKNNKGKFRQDIYSRIVRAGRRTYFFDVKSTRDEEYYLTITESKKRFFDQGKVHYEKHKIFLYREDFDKFTGCLREIIAFIDENQPPVVIAEKDNEDVTMEEEQGGSDYDNIEFDEA